VYVANNPIMRSDPTGHLFAEDASLRGNRSASATPTNILRPNFGIQSPTPMGQWQARRIITVIVLPLAVPLIDLFGRILEGLLDPLARTRPDSAANPSNNTNPNPSRGVDPGTDPATEPQPTDQPENRVFDLAFGIADYLPQFAATFISRPALYFMDWPEYIYTKPGGTQVRMRTSRSDFQNSFNYMMGVYLNSMPDGRFKFNLSGMADNSPWDGPDSSLTTWELYTIVTTPRYFSITDFYLYNGIGRPKKLSQSQADLRIDRILGLAG